MRVTIDIPDDLYRRVKAKTAEQGLKIRDVTIELFQMWLTNPATREGSVVQDRLRTLLTNHVGSFDSGINNLGSDPKHLEGFGEDPRNRR